MNTTFGERTLAAAGTSVRNSLPQSIRGLLLPERRVFARRLKTFSDAPPAAPLILNRRLLTL